MRILFIGAVQLSNHTLEKLIRLKANIVGVCTLAHSVFNSDHVDLSAICAKNLIPSMYAPDINDLATVEWIRERRPDVIFCFGWSRLLSSEVLSMPPLGVIGFHPAALPSNRGRHPLIWALALGLTETAATFFLMDEGADTGDILLQERIIIEECDDATTLYKKVTSSALSQIETLLFQLSAGTCQLKEQDLSTGNVWRKRTSSDGKIDWRMSARSIYNLVRALAKPYMGAHFDFYGEEIKLWKSAIVLDVPENIEPGKIIDVSGKGPVIKCGENALELIKTEPQILVKTGAYI